MPNAPTPDEISRFERVAAIFDAVCEIEGDARAAKLDELCAGDASILAEVEALLASESKHGTLFGEVEEGRGIEVVAGGMLSDIAESAETPRIDGYEIVREVGRGGMGVIYEARQASPSRRVALKVLRPSVGQGEVLRRFERESNVLAQLQHPSIAQIFEAGVASSGGSQRPFFSMEFVDGLPLDRHADEAGLDTRQRLELLARVCDAVGYANERGVIHRDLKPGNVLVVGPTQTDVTTSHGDSIGTPKVLDFGIARVTDPEFEVTTIETMAGQIIGTLAYMSPEQLTGNAEALDARCDVYALGVIAYELLTGQAAHQIRGLSVPEAARVVRDDDPMPLTTIDRSYAGDIATIIAKAMEKDPERRYANASELAADLRRHLSDVPIVARPASTFYQFSRFAKRNKGLVAGVAAAFVVLVLGVIGTGTALVAALDANAALDATNTELTETNRDLERVSEFLGDQLADVDPAAMGAQLRADLKATLPADVHDAFDDVVRPTSFVDIARSTLEANVFSKSEQVIGERFADDPLLRARLLQSLADTRRDLGLLDTAQVSQRQALDVRREELGERHPDYQASLFSMSQLRSALGDVGGSADDARTILEWRRATFGDTHESTIDAMNWLAAALRLTEDFEEGYNLAVETRALAEEHLGTDHEYTIRAIGIAGGILLVTGQSTEAVPLLEEANTRLERTRGEDDPEVIANRYDLASAFADLGRIEESERLFREAIEYYENTLGAEHPTTLGAKSSLAAMLDGAGRSGEAVELMRVVYAKRRELLGNQHPEVLVTANNLAAALGSVGDLEGSEELQRETFLIREQILGPNARSTLISAGNLGYIINAQGRPEEAESFYRRAAEGFRELEGPDSPNTLQAIQNYGVLLSKLGRMDEAAPLYAQSLEGRRRVLGDEHPATLNAIYNMGDLLRRQGDFDGAEPYCEQALEAYNRILGADHFGALYSAANLGRLRIAQGRLDEAEGLFRRAHDGFTRTSGPAHPNSIGTGRELVDVLEQLGKTDEAQRVRDTLPTDRDG